MKKFLALTLALMMLLTLTACGGGSNKKNIVGMWQIVDTETQTEYGMGIESVSYTHLTLPTMAVV